MWKVLLILVNVLSMINKIQGTLNSDCLIQGITKREWLTGYINDPVDDFHKEHFKKFSVKNIEGVQINGIKYAKYFSTKLEMEQLIIFPTDAFKYFEINEKNTAEPQMNVRLDFRCTTGSRSLHFYQPIRDNNNYRPTFEQAQYIYNLPTSLPGEFDVSVFGAKIIACDEDISNLRLIFTVNPPEDFYISMDGPVSDAQKCHKTILKTINPLKLTSGKRYQITVTDAGVPPLKSTAELKICINEDISLPPNPYFDSAHYSALYNSDTVNHSITISKAIRLQRDCSNLQFDILEIPYKDKFHIECSLTEVSVEMINNLPDEVWNNSVVLVTIQATLKYAEGPGATVLEIYRPKDQHLESTTADTCTVDCSPCPPISNSTNCQQVATTAAPFVTTLHFIQENYIVSTEFCHIGYLETVTAISLPKENIEYYLPFDSEFLEYNKQSGVLRKIKCAASGIYYFKVCAKGIRSRGKACANVLLHEKSPVSGSLNLKKLLVRHIVEEYEGKVPLPCYQDCTCVIFEQYPEITEELFKCEFNNIYASALDREMEELADMEWPQFTLQLGLKETDSAISPSSYSNPHSLFKREAEQNRSPQEWVFIPTNIFDERNRMLVTFVIDDINDNPPAFKAGDKLVVGYPSKALSALISPPYLAKVVATDPDAGENATIRYSISAGHPNTFIHPETGVIYIGKDDFSDETNLNFTVTATDRNGAEDGLSTDLLVEVKLLKGNHILILKQQNIMLEEVEDNIDTLSKSTNLVIKHLTATVILTDDFLSSQSSYFTQIYIYGFTSENELLNATDLQAILMNSLSFTKQIFEVPFTYIQDEEEESKKSSIIGCIIIPAVLLLVFVIPILAVGGYYHCRG